MHCLNKLQKALTIIFYSFKFSVHSELKETQLKNKIKNRTVTITMLKLLNSINMIVKLKGAVFKRTPQ